MVYYISQVNGLNLVDIIFLLACVSVCVHLQLCPCGECVSCHRLVGNPTRNNAKTISVLGYFKSFERYLLFPIWQRVYSRVCKCMSREQMHLAAAEIGRYSLKC